MQHVLNIAFDFDDDKIRSVAEKSVSTELDKTVKDIVLDQIAPMTKPSYPSYYSNKMERDWSRFNAKVDKQIADFLALHKGEIIDHAADKLVDSLKRTKAWKEKYGEII